MEHVFYNVSHVRDVSSPNDARIAISGALKSVVRRLIV
jgi:hypothetical protein